MIAQIWALSQKTLILFFIISMLVFAKVEKIDDEFDGTYYYKTDSILIRYYKEGQMLEYRFRTTKEKDNHRIAIQLNVLGNISVDADDRVYVKCSNNHIIALKYQSVYSYLNNGFSYWMNSAQSIKAQAILSDKDIEAILSGITMIRIEIKDGYANLNIKPKDSKTTVKKLEEIIKKVEEDKK